MKRHLWLMLGLSVQACFAAGAAQAAYGLQPPVTMATPSEPTGVIVADVTGDGRDDIVVATGDPETFPPEGYYSFLVFVQKPDGTLDAPVVVAMDGTPSKLGLGVADFNEDQVDDVLLVGNAGAEVLFGSRAGAFHSTHFDRAVNLNSDPTWVIPTDFDLDGHVDIMASGDAPGGAWVLFGDGMGGVREQFGNFNRLASADLDRNGVDDLMIYSRPESEDSYGVYVETRSPDGSLHPRGVLARFRQPSGILYQLGFGDFDGNGRPDIAVAGASDAPTSTVVLRQLQPLRFAPAMGATDAGATGLRVADLDRDGRDDLVVAHDTSRVGVYLGGPAGLGGEALYDYPAAETSVGIGIGDVDGDGVPDVVTAGKGRGLVIFPGRLDQAPQADLSVRLSATPSTAVARVSNAPGGIEAVAAPLVMLELRARGGSLVLGTLPPGCATSVAEARHARVDCLLDAMSPGDATDIVVPYSNPGVGGRAELRLAASAQTDTTERTLSNNRAILRYVPATGTAVAAPPRGPGHRAARAAD